MKILLSYIHYPVCSGRYVKDALVRLGHDVKSVGYSTQDSIWNMRVSSRHVHWADGQLDEIFPRWKPDLVVLMESAWKYHHPAYADVPHVVYGVDNHVRDYRQDGISHYFLAHKAVSVMDMSAEDVTWLPCGYDPVAFQPSSVAYDARNFDVTLIGVMYPERVTMLDALEKDGLKVKRGLGYLYDEYAGVYHQTRVALNVSAKNDLNQRIFETAAMGCVVLTDAVPDLSDIDVPSGAIVTYKTQKEAVKLAKSGVKNSPTIDTSWLKNHTWEARGQVVIDWYQKTYSTQPKARKTRETNA